jgi:hypothetical protein
MEADESSLYHGRTGVLLCCGVCSIVEVVCIPLLILRTC